MPKAKTPKQNGRVFGLPSKKRTGALSRHIRGLYQFQCSQVQKHDVKERWGKKEPGGTSTLWRMDHHQGPVGEAMITLLIDRRDPDELGHYLKKQSSMLRSPHWWRPPLSGRTRFRTLLLTNHSEDPFSPIPVLSCQHGRPGFWKGEWTHYLWARPQAAWVTALACTGRIYFPKFYAGLDYFNNNMHIYVYIYIHTPIQTHIYKHMKVFAWSLQVLAWSLTQKIWKTILIS